MPDVFGIFHNGAVAGEIADFSHVDNGFFRPFLRIGIILFRIMQRFVERLQVGKQEVVVAVQQFFVNNLEQQHIVLFAEHVGVNGVQNAAQVFRVLITGARIVCVVFAHFLNLFFAQAEQIEVVGADGFADFDVGAVMPEASNPAVEL